MRILNIKKPHVTVDIEGLCLIALTCILGMILRLSPHTVFGIFGNSWLLNRSYLHSSMHIQLSYFLNLHKYSKVSYAGQENY